MFLFMNILSPALSPKYHIDSKTDADDINTPTTNCIREEEV